MSQRYVNTTIPDDLSCRFELAFHALMEFMLVKTSKNVTEVLNDVIPTLWPRNVAYLRFAANKSEDVSVLSAVVTHSKDWQIRYLTGT